MKTTVKLTGLTAPVIRMWENRYGWPSPRRLDNGYRIYSEDQIEDLKLAGALVKAGTPVSQLVDGKGGINLPRPKKPLKRPILSLAHKVPLPSRAEALKVRDLLLDGFHCQDAGKVLLALAQALTLHPSDRAPACFAPACAALVDLQIEGKALDKQEKIIAALDLAMGGGQVVQETMGTFLQYVVIKNEAQAQ
jgi:hypothetical protein